MLNLFIITIFLSISYSDLYTVDCDYMGDCNFIVDNKTYEISQREIPLYKEISDGQIEHKWNDTFYLLKLEKQIDGISNYGLLKGTKNGYECSGGLSECKDSCCLDGFCVEILFFCDRENEHITVEYVYISSCFFVLLIFYWITYFMMGCKYKDDLTKTMNEEEELYLFLKVDKIDKTKGNANSVSVSENFHSNVPMMNNIMKMKPNVLNN